MPTHLYCLLPGGSSVVPPNAPAVRALDVNGIIAWVSETADARLSRDVRDATRATIEHDRVVGAALAQGVTPVPASLADPYESDAAARADIAPYAAKIEAALHELDGMVEMTTIIAVSSSPPAENLEGRGRAYLEQLRSLPSRAAAIADQTEQVLAPVFGTARRRADGGRIGLSHLVPLDRIEEYRRSTPRKTENGSRSVTDGPRAPYSFASFIPRKGFTAEILRAGP